MAYSSNLKVEVICSSEILEMRGLCPIPCFNSGLVRDNECLKGHDRIPCIGDLQDANGFLEFITCSRICKELKKYEAYDRCYIV
jgi:hypothetical protein